MRRIVTLGVELLGSEGLGVQLIGDRDIVVSSPQSGFSITYRKDGLAPLLMAVDGIDRSSETIEGKILGASLEGGLSESPYAWLAKSLTSFSAAPSRYPTTPRRRATLRRLAQPAVESHRSVRPTAGPRTN